MIGPKVFGVSNQYARSRSNSALEKNVCRGHNHWAYFATQNASFAAKRAGSILMTYNQTDLRRDGGGRKRETRVYSFHHRDAGSSS